jgi:hypothetical protein
MAHNFSGVVAIKARCDWGGQPRVTHYVHDLVSCLENPLVGRSLEGLEATKG